MLTATVIAVALGLTPVDADAPNQVVSGDYAARVGRYSQIIDSRGAVYVRGVDPHTGAAYELTIDPAGLVKADVGDSEIDFRVAPAR